MEGVMLNIRATAMHYKAIKSAYSRYLAAYRTLNNGSLVGAKVFFEFYYYLNYTNRYSDPRACVPLGYR